MSLGHVVSAKANLRAAQVKGAHAPGRSQNHSPEAAQSIQQAQKAQKTVLPK